MMSMKLFLCSLALPLSAEASMWGPPIDNDEKYRGMSHLRDPRTVERKVTIFDNAPKQGPGEVQAAEGDDRALTGFHLFGKGNNDRSGDSQLPPLRFLAFGTSRTWGSGLEDRLKQAYPYLLSPEATNLGKRATGPTYPSLCTQSLVGTRVYDVIVLEFYMDNAESVVRLAKRLRGRFPNAMIIFIRLWLPSRYRLKNAPPGQKSMKKWANANGFADHNTKEFKDFLISETSPDDWELLEKSHYSENVWDAAHEVGGHIVTMPSPKNAHEAILDYGQYFLPDMIHFSPIGHSYIKQAIENEIKDKKFFRRQNEVHPWDERDDCDDWHESGMSKEPYSEELQMVEYSPGKHALEVPVGGGYIQVVNPMHYETDVYLNYLVTGPEKKYPKVIAGLKRQQNHANFIGEPVSIQPWQPEAQSDVHITDMVKVGTIPPRGRPVLVILPDDDGGSKFPFRITGVAIVKPQERDENHHSSEEVVIFDKASGAKAITIDDESSEDDDKTSSSNNDDDDDDAGNKKVEEINLDEESSTSEDEDDDDSASDKSSPNNDDDDDTGDKKPEEITVYEPSSRHHDNDDDETGGKSVVGDSSRSNNDDDDDEGPTDKEESDDDDSTDNNKKSSREGKADTGGSNDDDDDEIPTKKRGNDDDDDTAEVEEVIVSEQRSLRGSNNKKADDDDDS